MEGGALFHVSLPLHSFGFVMLTLRRKIIDAMIIDMIIFSCYSQFLSTFYSLLCYIKLMSVPGTGVIVKIKNDLTKINECVPV